MWYLIWHKSNNLEDILLFNKNEIKDQVLKNYNIKINQITHESRGSANIFYITDVENKKYVFKEFESRCKEEKILQEAEILYFLKNKYLK